MEWTTIITEVVPLQINYKHIISASHTFGSFYWSKFKPTVSQYQKDQYSYVFLTVTRPLSIIVVSSGNFQSYSATFLG